MNTHNTAPTQFIEAGGIRFAYRTLGADKGVPLVLMGHFRATMENWDPLVSDGLAKGRRVILFSNQGIGLSSGQTPDTIAEMASDAILFIDALGLTQVDLLGFSMGGFIAQEIVLARPELVRKLILAGTGPEGGEDMQIYIPEVTKAATNEVTTLEDFLILFFPPSEAGQNAGRAFWKRRNERKEDIDIPSTMQVMQAQGNAIGAWGIPNPAYTKLKQIKHPTLVANGYNDIMVPTVNSIILFQQLLNSKLILYPDSGHGFLFQYPEEFVTDVTLFLDKA